MILTVRIVVVGVRQPLVTKLINSDDSVASDSAPLYDAILPSLTEHNVVLHSCLGCTTGLTLISYETTTNARCI